MGSPAYMDERVEKKMDYDHTADLYSLGMVYLCVFKGKGIYDDCKTLTEMKRARSEINSDYDNNIERHLQDLPFPMKDIIKNCLNPDHRTRYQAGEIA